MHIDLVGQLTALARIALHTGGYNVVPCGFATLFPRDDMIQIELGFRKGLEAILTRELITPEHIST